GYLTRLPDAEQQKRSGGGGVYYHLSYWGRPHDYLWLTTTLPGLIYSEMKTAYDHNCRKLWIANVHDPKVAAYQLELFLDMAWDINSITADANHCPRLTSQSTALTIEQHLERWLSCQFGPQVGQAIFPAMRELYHLHAIRRPEFMGWTQVELDKKQYPGGKSVPSQTEFTLDEGYRRMEAFARIEATVETWRPLVPAERQDAYFAHVLYPVHAAAAMTRKMLAPDAESRQAYDEIQQLTARYNALCDGKWRGLMSASPRALPVFGQVRTSFSQSSPAGSYVARNASQFCHATSGCKVIPMLGHSMQAVTLTKGDTLTYEFDSPQDGDAVLYTAMIPTQPSDRGDLRYQVCLDGTSATISLKTPYRSERWKQSVLRGQSLNATPVRLTKGRHRLLITALDSHIIADQWMIDFCPDRKFYVIPQAYHQQQHHQ
nr:glycosyl hydrolase 115 family protein [Prevotella sp.]